MKPTYIDSPGKADLIEWLTSDFPAGKKWQAVSPDGETIAINHDKSNTGLWLTTRKCVQPEQIIWREFKVLVKEVVFISVRKLKLKLQAYKRKLR